MWSYSLLGGECSMLPDRLCFVVSYSTQGSCGWYRPWLGVASWGEGGGSWLVLCTLLGVLGRRCRSSIQLHLRFVNETPLWGVFLSHLFGWGWPQWQKLKHPLVSRMVWTGLVVVGRGWMWLCLLASLVQCGVLLSNEMGCLFLWGLPGVRQCWQNWG